MKNMDLRTLHRLAALAGGLAIAVALDAPMARGAGPILPSAGSVVAGSASITTPAENKTLITQSSQKAIINWQSFSIGTGSTVSFQQPNNTAITLNRVTGTNASTINGNLLANGQVWLLNGNGILFSQGSRINVGGLIATTSDIRDADFLAGKNSFGIASGNPNAAVMNQGSISAANGGSVVLSGSHVVNEGTITANLGHVVLGGAGAFSVDFDGDNLLGYAIAAPVSETPKNSDGTPAQGLVSNSGAITAQGGKVLLTTRAARDVVNNVINSTGIVEATTVSMRNGEIVLDAGDGGAVSVAGRLDASGVQAGESGGTIKVLGDTVSIADGAHLDASGNAGGGTILIGGNLHGTGPEPNAQMATVGEAAITADATRNGNGGTVVVFSSGETNVAGSLTAKGGSVAGDGGTVETSGHNLKIAEGTHVDTSAPAGATGYWLLDPQDITIAAGGTGTLSSGSLTLGSNPGVAVTIAPSTITSSLAVTNVRLEATNDIIVSSELAYNSANSLTLLALRNVTFNASVQNNGSGSIVVNSGGNITIASGKSLSVNQTGNHSQDALVLAAAGNFINQAGSAGLSVTGGGRWLVFLQNPANNSAGGLSAAPFYNRSFNFATGNYTPVAASGNRFVYTLAPTITVTVNNQTKLYGTVNPAFTANLTGLVAGDTLAGAVSGTPLFGTSASTLSRVGDYSVIATQGTLASDYNYGFQFVNGNLHINPAPLAASLTGTVSKRYDGTTVATAAPGNYILSGAVPGDNVTVNAAFGFYDNKNVGSGKLVTMSGLTLSGNDAVNYVLLSTNASAAVGTITTGALTVNLAGVVSKRYDGTAQATLAPSNYAVTGAAPGDSVIVNTPLGGFYDNKNAGSGKLVTVSGLTLSGNDAANYILTSTNASGSVGTITPATLTAGLTGTVSRTYNGTVLATLAPSNFTLTGALAGDSVTLNTAAGGTYDNKNVGNGKLVTVSGLALLGNDAGNYVLASTNLSGAIGTITAATLTAGLTGTVTKTFDGTVIATLTPDNYTLTGAFSGDSVTLNAPLTGAYDNRNAGTEKLVTVSGLALLGGDAGNYILAATNVSGPIGTINAPPINGGVLTALIQQPTVYANSSSVTSMGSTPPTLGGTTTSAPGTPGSTSDGSADTQAVDTVANNVGQSLDGTRGSVPSSTIVLIAGLLHQFVPPVGASTPQGIPPADQSYSSWGNEAFWQ